MTRGPVLHGEMMRLRPIEARDAERLWESLQDPEVLAAFAAAGVTVSPATAHQTTEFVAKDVARWQELAKKANLTLDQ